MKRLVLAIVAREGELRMNVSLARQSRGSKRWPIDKGNVPGNSVGADKNCKDIR